MKYLKIIHIALVRVFFVAAAMMLAGPTILYAASDLPYTFSPGQTISSAQVNANFQALSAQIAALQAQLAPAPPVSPVSIVGIYDYFSFGIGMEVESFGGTAYNYKVTRNSYQGTLVFDANGTVTINGTGGYTMMQIMNERSFLCGATSGCSTTDPRQYSLMSGTVNTIDPTDIGTTSYTVNGSTITAVGGFVGTLSADGKIFVGRSQSNATGIVIGIRRPPTITSATSTTADGHYNAGASINITLNFSEAVTSTGLTIALNSGATITTGALSNAPSWSGTYTAGMGQTSSDLSISTITGTITSVFSTSNPTIPAGKNIGDSKAIVIE